MSRNRALSSLMLPVPAPHGVSGYGEWGFHVARGALRQAQHWGGPTQLLPPEPVLTHHQHECSCPRARPGIRGIYKSRLVQASASCLITTCCHTMLGGLGKLAAEGLAHRTEKATEEAGKDPGAPFPLRCSSHWGTQDRLDWASEKLIPAGFGQALVPWRTKDDQLHRHGGRGL